MLFQLLAPGVLLDHLDLQHQGESPMDHTIQDPIITIQQQPTASSHLYDLPEESLGIVPRNFAKA